MLEKKIILLTGGNSRLGRVIAQALIDEGHKVYCTSRKPITSKDKNIYFIRIDVTSDGSVHRGIAEILKKEKRIDVVINNAAVTVTGPVLNFTANDFLTLLNTNVVGMFRVIKESCSHSKKPSLIINITSLNGFLAVPNFGLYSATKFAAEALGKTLRYELSPSVKVVNIAPGALKAESEKKMGHKPAREKFPILDFLLPLTTLEEVAKRIIQLIAADSVPPRVVIGKDAVYINILQRIFPVSLFDKLIFYIMRKK